MSAFHDNALMGASGSQGYTISRSVRLRSSASAYFNRTPASASNRKTYTFSCWAKRGSLSSNQNIVAQGNNEVLFRFNTTDNINFADYTGGSAVWEITSSSVYRDPSAWYHIVFAVDTTQATSSNRVKVWINNSQVTFTGTYPTLNSDTPFNTTNAILIGNRTGVSQYYDGYLTEINFIDGQALTPSSFGETDSITGVWKAKKYGGTYGTNGFYLNFSDNSSNTATTIGKDYSGNGNNWTPNNISVTAGTTYDSMVDSPTVSAVSSNYAVWNPLKATAGTYSNANLSVLRSGAANVDLPVSTLQIPKTVPIYCEFSFGNQDSSYGIAKDTSNSGVNGIVGSSTDGASYGAYITTSSTYYGFWNNNSRTSFDFSGGTIYQMAFDQANGKLWFGKDGTWYNSGNPANGTNPTFSSISTTNDFFVAALATTSACSVNFGQRPFTYTPPTGFVALNTNNLPVPTIKNGAGYMAATLYTGTGSSLAVSNAVNGSSFQPDLVWVKSRSAATDHALYDSVRGTQSRLESNTTDAQATSDNGLTAFGSGGFTVNTLAQVNTSSATYVGWQWKANGSAVTNTAGSITSTVSAGATQGFSVVTYTGTGANATVGHGLGVAPSMYLVKSRSLAGENWIVYHTSLGNAQQLNLNTTAAQAASTNFNSTSPTSSVFSIGSGTAVNSNTNTYVAYCFAAVAGYSAFGSYTGNGSTDGPFVYTGFRPRFILVKSSSGAFDWHITDTSRSTYNQADTVLFPNSSAAESNGGGYYYDLLSNGFKCRNLGSATNGSGATYIFAAFAESPFKTSLAR